jgi:transposase
MNEEDLLKCPLLQNLDAMHRAELLGLVNDSNLREKLEKCLTHHLEEESKEVAKVGGKEAQTHDFEKEVHSWNPQRLIFSRSPKE